MLFNSLFTALSLAYIVTTLPTTDDVDAHTDTNPFLGKTYFANPFYAAELNQTIASFLAQNDTLNAARIRTVQKTGTFVWITSVSGLSLLNSTIAAAKKVERHTRHKQIVELVLYNLPDRDCSAGQSSGEFPLANNGLELYKHAFVDLLRFTHQIIH